MPSLSWFKGNIHTHTSEDHGDSKPDAVRRWYRRHGYDFLVLTHHNLLTPLHEPRRRSTRPLLITGEEVSAEGRIHVGAIGLSRLVEPVNTPDTVSTLQANIDAILDAGGVACINHPNDDWALDHETISQVHGASLLEVFNGVIYCNSFGGPGKFSGEEIWDAVLSAGNVIYGVAVDDAHVFKDFAHDLDNPGRGWVMVQAMELTADSIIEGLKSGNFYASTGVTLSSLYVRQQQITIKIDQPGNFVFNTAFVGRGGIVLHEEAGTRPAYRIRGDEGYVRARVMASSGALAWTQPIFVSDS